MSAITNNYNVVVNSRFYAFLQDDMESAEPQVLIAKVKKKRELQKESKTKVKKQEKQEKRQRQIAEAKKEIPTEVTEEVVRIEEPVAEVVNEVKPEIKKEDKLIEPVESAPTETSVEPCDVPSDRGQRGRGNNRRGNRGGSYRNDGKRPNGDKLNNEDRQRSFASNRGRPYRQERTDDRNDSFNKVGYFEDQQQTNYRGSTDRRRSYPRGPRYIRSFERAVNNEEVAGDNVELSNDGVDKVPSRGTRGRFPRANRGGGGYNRYPRSETEDGMEFYSNRMGYFEENVDNREYRDRGRSRGGGNRGMRRGRGDYRRPREYENEEGNKEENNFRDEPEMTPAELAINSWDMDHENDDMCAVPTGDNDTTVMSEPRVTEAALSDDKKTADWGEIEDDPLEVKEESKPHMTLEEWKAINSKDRILNQSSKEIRKANDGQDVFSGMSEYRKGKLAEEQGEDAGHDAGHDPSHGRVRQAISVAVRFSGPSLECSDPPMKMDNASRGGYQRGSGGGGRRSSGRGGRDFNEANNADYGSDGRFAGPDWRSHGRGGSDFYRQDRGESYSNNRRGRGGGTDYSSEGRQNSDVGVVDESGNSDFTRRDFGRRGRGSGAEFVRRGDRGGYNRRGRGGGVDDSGEDRVGTEERENTDLHGRGRPDFVRRERDGADFGRGGRGGGSEFNEDGRSYSDFQGRGRTDFVRREKGGSEFSRRGRGGGSDFIEEDKIGTEERSYQEFRGRGRTDFVKRDRGGSDFGRRGRGGGSDERGGTDFGAFRRGRGEFVRRDRGGSDFSRFGRDGGMDGYAEERSGMDDNGRAEFVRRGRGGSDFHRRGGGSDLNAEDHGGSLDVVNGGRTRGRGEGVRRERGGSHYGAEERDGGDMELSSYGRGRDFNRSTNRGGARGYRGANQYHAASNREQHQDGFTDDTAGININLCNEDEFPQLS